MLETEEIGAEITNVLSDLGYDFIDVNFFPFETNKVVIAFGHSSDRYYFVLALEDISGWASMRQRGLLEFPVGHKVADLMRAYKEAREGRFKRLSEMDIFTLLLHEATGRVELDEITAFLGKEVPLMVGEVRDHFAEIDMLIKVLDLVEEAKARAGLEGVKKFMYELEEIKSLQDLKPERLTRIFKELERCFSPC